jgi:hypothetical protein
MKTSSQARYTTVTFKGLLEKVKHPTSALDEYKHGVFLFVGEVR